MTARDLPDGWRWAKLGEICDIVNGSTPKSGTQEFWGGEICWVTPADLGQLSGRYITASSRTITQEGYDSCSTTLVPAGSVIISSRAPIGHLGIATVPLCTNQGCKAFIPREGLDTEYLYYALQISLDQIRKLGSGATFPEVGKRVLAAFQIPLPPIEEQKRRIKMLIGQLEHIGRAQTAADMQVAALEAMPAALLRKFFPRSDSAI